MTRREDPLWIWTMLLLRLGLVLLAVGILPVIAAGTFLPELDPVVPVLLSLLVAPLGGLALLAAAILFLARTLKQRQGPS